MAETTPHSDHAGGPDFFASKLFTAQNLEAEPNVTFFYIIKGVTPVKEYSG